MLKWRKDYDTNIFQNDKWTWKENLDVFLRLVKDNAKVTVQKKNKKNVLVIIPMTIQISNGGKKLSKKSRQTTERRQTIFGPKTQLI